MSAPFRFDCAYDCGLRTFLVAGGGEGRFSKAPISRKWRCASFPARAEMLLELEDGGGESGLRSRRGSPIRIRSVLTGLVIRSSRRLVFWKIGL